LTALGVNVGLNADTIKLLTGTVLKDVTLIGGPNVVADGVGAFIIRDALPGTEENGPSIYAVFPGPRKEPPGIPDIPPP
jgi:hypothetical protein